MGSIIIISLFAPQAVHRVQDCLKFLRPPHEEFYHPNLHQSSNCAKCNMLKLFFFLGWNSIRRFNWTCYQFVITLWVTLWNFKILVHMPWIRKNLVEINVYLETKPKIGMEVLTLRLFRIWNISWTFEMFQTTKRNNNKKQCNDRITRNFKHFEK